MSSIRIHDLPQRRELDRQAQSRVRGGAAWLKQMGPGANVKVDVNQNIVQLQDIEVNTLNNVGFIGAGFGPLDLKLSPTQSARNRVAL